MAIGGTYTFKVEGYSLNHILSIGKPRNNFHLVLGAAGAEDNDPDYIYGAGYRNTFKPNTSFLCEVITTKSILEEEADGLIIAGFRFHSKRVSWNLSGFRALPLGIVTSGFCLLSKRRLS